MTTGRILFLLVLLSSPALATGPVTCVVDQPWNIRTLNDGTAMQAVGSGSNVPIRRDGDGTARMIVGEPCSYVYFARLMGGAEMAGHSRASSPKCHLTNGPGWKKFQAARAPSTGPGKTMQHAVCGA